jgi:hypothetical protein
MRLINVETLQFEDVSGKFVPPYAILSHTWTADEVTFEEMIKWQMSNSSMQSVAEASSDLPRKHGWQKILAACHQTRADHLNYVWIDTCCIDKKSSAELSEAINSMFLWYRKAAICYAYLFDLPSKCSRLEQQAALSSCRWFTRGWTLQELIAPRHLTFYDEEWGRVGDSKELSDIIEKITHIPKPALIHKQSLDAYSVAERMMWASRRDTTRVEDAAYCLLGIFDVNIPLIYGEGRKAFLRLQEEIIKRRCDYSIFLWKPIERPKLFAATEAVLASEPAEFMWLQNYTLHRTRIDDLGEFTVTNDGIRFTSQLLEGPCTVDEPRTDLQNTRLISRRHVIFLATVIALQGTTVAVVGSANPPTFRSIGLILKKIGPNRFVRDLGRNGGLCEADEYFSYGKRRTLPHTFYVQHNSIESQIISKSERIYIDIQGLDLVSAAPLSKWDGARRFFFRSGAFELQTLVLKPINSKMLYDQILVVVDLFNRNDSRLYVVDRRNEVADRLLNAVSTPGWEVENSHFDLSPYYYLLSDLSHSTAPTSTTCVIQLQHRRITLEVLLFPNHHNSPNEVIRVCIREKS